MHKYIYCFFLTLLFMPVVHAEIYKWVDEQGRVHYGDKPVENSEQLAVSEEPSEGAAASGQQERQERRKRLLQAFEEDRAEKNKQKEKQAKEKARLERKCILARDHLRNYKSAGRLYRLDKDGNRITMSDEEKLKATEHLRQNIEKYCN